MEKLNTLCAQQCITMTEKIIYSNHTISTKVLLGGWRHPCCGTAYMAVNKDVKRWDDCIQGFLTIKNRFLNRQEAYELVIETGQLTKPLIGGELTSEDLW